MSDKAEKAKATEETTVAATDESLKAIIPSGTVLSGTTIYNQPWFNVWVPQALPGTISGGVVVPGLTGSGYAGQNVAGFVFQNDQYNTSIRGF